MGKKSGRVRRASKLLILALMACLTLPSSAEDRCVKSQDIFPVHGGAGWGFINRSGATVVPEKYDLVKQFSDGLAEVYLAGKPAFVDQSGKIRFQTQADRAQEFTEGLAGAKIRGKWGFVDKAGRVVIEPEYDSVLPFSEGLAAVRGGDEWKYIDRSGKTALIPAARGWNRRSLDSFHEGRARLQSSDGKFGYIDITGDWAVTPRFNYERHFSEGLAEVEVDERWGYIDRKGNLIVPMRFAWTAPFHEGLAAVATSNSTERAVGFITRDGSYAIAPMFDSARSFCGGLAPVSISKRFGYVNRWGALVVATKFEEAFSFVGDLGYVIWRDEVGIAREAYISKDGRVVWVSSEALPSVEY